MSTYCLQYILFGGETKMHWKKRNSTQPLNASIDYVSISSLVAFPHQTYRYPRLLRMRVIKFLNNFAVFCGITVTAHWLRCFFFHLLSCFIPYSFFRFHIRTTFIPMPCIITFQLFSVYTLQCTLYNLYIKCRICAVHTEIRVVQWRETDEERELNFSVTTKLCILCISLFVQWNP